MNEFEGIETKPVVTVVDQLFAMRGRRFNEDEAAWESDWKEPDTKAIARAEQLFIRLCRQQAALPDMATGDGTGAVVLSRRDCEKREIETYEVQPSGEIKREIYVDQILRLSEKVEL